MKNQSDQTPGSNATTDEAASTDRGVGSSRRRFIKGGAAAAPVILTFTSRPVLGFEQACMSPSRMISGNHSGFSGPTTCGGTSLSNYNTAANVKEKDQPAWCKLKFTDVFGKKNPYANKVQDRFGDVFLDSYAKNDSTAPSAAQFAAYLIAAYLNASTNSTVSGVLKPAQVVEMWNDVIGTTTGFCPQIGMCWNATGVIGYLQYSGIVPAA